MYSQYSCFQAMEAALVSPQADFDKTTTSSTLLLSNYFMFTAPQHWSALLTVRMRSSLTERWRQ